MAMVDQDLFTHIFFMDGVGMGGPDADVNPFALAAMPCLKALLGDGWYLMDRGRLLHFEVTRPSLHDIFVRIAKPDREENGHA